MSEQQASWSDGQHRPKHMRWRDKMAYLDKTAKPMRAAGGGAKEGVQVDLLSEDSMIESSEGSGFLKGLGSFGSFMRRSSTDSRDTKDESATEMVQQTTPRSGGPATAVTTGTAPATAAKPRRQYSAGFKRHPRHISFKEKMAYLRGESLPKAHYKSQPEQ
eukprot:CAMPEP_0117656082 /NCGR_PEP_ID=MMETSP0804-20121206/4618_1 /TAXON_ID=1074897 /ORGANISM="Tetraselmis astigmatica, Strain CCMP880" /LENGTH=160 /DNA_ID=CAMNT_0005462467 /DNA_START=70 /DNA_END=552 /DNA_ORIENTATION=+